MPDRSPARPPRDEPAPRLRLAPEYGCHPLWTVSADGGLRNVAPSELALPPSLAVELDGWDDRYQDTFVDDDPAASGFEASAAIEHAREGAALAARVAAALGEAVDDRPIGSSPRERLRIEPDRPVAVAERGAGE